MLIDLATSSRESSPATVDLVSPSSSPCLLYTSDAADDTPCVDLDNINYMFPSVGHLLWTLVTVESLVSQKSSLQSDKQMFVLSSCC